MEHFASIQTLVRVALGGDPEAIRKQVERLHARLEKAGSTKEASAIGRLLAAAADRKEVAPSRVELQRGLVRGERLRIDAVPPVDRETGASLCEIVFVGEDAAEPLYGEMERRVVDDLLEEWSRVDAMRQAGLEPTASLLIFGPPGSGKTLTAHHIAGRLGLPLLSARIDGLISSFLGTTARNIGSLFDFANRHACVLLLDEFDALAKLRDDPGEIGEIKRVVNSLLQNLDGRRASGLTIAITNHDNLLDAAVWRRFETQLHLGDPDVRTRRALVTRFLASASPSEEMVRLVVHTLPDLSGADLERVCLAVKRQIVLRGHAADDAGTLHALAEVLNRMPSAGPDARSLAADPEAFAAEIADDPGLGLKVGDLARLVGVSPARLSKLRHRRRTAAEVVDAR